LIASASAIASFSKFVFISLKFFFGFTPIKEE